MCFGRDPWTLVASVALLPLFFILTRRWAFAFGLLHGVAAWWVSLRWIVGTLEEFGGLSHGVALALLGLLTIYLGLYHAVFAWLGGRIWRSGRVVGVLFALPALWVALEWVRRYLLGGFPWNLAAYAWVDLPGALPLAAWVGAFGVSYLLLWGHAAWALAAARRSWELALLAVLVPFVIVTVGGRWGGGRPAPTTAARGLPVRILQPDTGILVDADREAILAGYREILDMSYRACDVPGTLLIWPESAAWPFSFDSSAGLRRDLHQLAEAGCAVVFNSSRREGGKIFNSMLLLTSSAPPMRYDKRHLVPFGEYVPLARVFSFVERLARSAGDFTPGDEPRLLPFQGEKLGPAICYEVIFGDEVADLVQAGATSLVSVTNDAWYGDTAAPHQHLRAARFRAAESRRPMVRAALTGVSAAIGADGAVLERLDVGARGILRYNLVGRRDLSPYTRFPWLVPWLAVLATIFAIFRTWREGKR